MLRILFLATVLYSTTAYPRVPFPKDSGDSIFRVRGPNQIVDAEWLNPAMLNRAPERTDWTQSDSFAIRVSSGWQITLDPTRQPNASTSFGEAERCSTRTGYRYCR